MAKFEPPPKFSFKPEYWDDWLQEFKQYRSCTGLKKEDGETQRDALLYAMGSKEATKIFNSFTFTRKRTREDGTEETVQESKDDFDVVSNKFTSYFIPSVNKRFERARFMERKQQENESVEEFVREIGFLIKTCQYQDSDDMILDRLVQGLRDGEVRQKLELMQDLTLDKAVKFARQHELVKKQELERRKKFEVQYVYSPRGRGSHGYGHRGRGQDRGKPAYRTRNTPPPPSHKEDNPCDRCGGHHGLGRCPAKGKICSYCKIPGHFVRCCRKRKYKEAQTSRSSSGKSADELVSLVDSFYIGVVTCEDSEKPWSTYLIINNKEVEFKIDTGADVSIMSEKEFLSLPNRPKLMKSTAKLNSLAGRIQVSGEFQAAASHNGEEYKFRVIVSTSATNNILSRSVSKKMNVVNINHIEDRDSPVFGKTGLMETPPVKIEMYSDAKPYGLTTARRIPFPIVNKVKEELDRMEGSGIIKAIANPTEWCAPMVPVIKRNGDIRICVDFKKLNQAVKRPHLMLPNLGDITPKLSGAKVFSTLDISGGFFQIPLCQESAPLTTFITPFGRYCFQRMPMGINLGPEVFQRKMHEKFGNLEGCEIIMDDILVYGKSMEEHDFRLKQVLDAIQEAGVKLNAEKCRFRKKSVVYFGHIVSAEGLQPDPGKTEAIRNMPAPSNITELRSLLGMLNYLSKFVSDMATVVKPMSDLLRADVVFSWSSPQQAAFEEVKKRISKVPVLSYYRTDRPTIVSADASNYGVGAVLLQRDDEGQTRPIAFASRTLTNSEKKWAQIEKEALASVWACEKFSKYLVGLPKFDLWTDHKPLVPLMTTTDLDQAPIRCQRLLLRLMRFNPEVTHIRGKDLVIADALSRNPKTGEDKAEIDVNEVEFSVDTLKAQWPASEKRLQQIEEETLVDPELQRVKQYIQHGWPISSRDVSPSLKPYLQTQSQLSLVDNLVTFGSRIVIPRSLRKEMLGRLHESHQGVNKCRENAQMCIWWPGISKDIFAEVDKCLTCRQNRPSQRGEPLIPSPLPSRPWESVSADLCEFKKKHYLIVVDKYSRWVEVKFISSLSSLAIISRLKDVIATHGVFDSIMTDNGPQFVSNEFKDFAAMYGFQHTTSSPHFPQSNGEVESAVKIAKSILQQDDTQLALLNYRTTRHSATGVSPAEALMGRRLKTRLPVLVSLLTPKPSDHDEISSADTRSKQLYKFHYDRRNGTRLLEPLQPGKEVLAKTDGEKSWDVRGRVVRADLENRTYIIQTPSGDLRRNRKHLQPVAGKAEVETPSADEALKETQPTSDTDVPIRHSTRIIKPPIRFIEEN